jgi:hypothetical protein
MKRLLTLVLGLALATLGVASAQAQPCGFFPCGNPLSVSLLVNRTTNVGSVTVSNDASFIYVNYTATAPNLLTGLHLAVATSLNGIPHSSSGAPTVSSFSRAATFKPGVSTYTFAIPVSQFNFGQQLYIAAEAELLKPSSGSSTNHSGSHGGDDGCDDNEHHYSVVSDPTVGGSPAVAGNKTGSGGGHDDDCENGSQGSSIVKHDGGGSDDGHCGCSGGGTQLVAWGNGTRFSGSQDAMYFKYTVQACGGE